jgi:hypothetical protein
MLFAVLRLNKTYCFIYWQGLMVCSVCGHLAFLFFPIGCICISYLSLSVSFLYYRPVLMSMVFIIFSVFYLFCYFHFCLFLVFSPSNFWFPSSFVGICSSASSFVLQWWTESFPGSYSGRNYKPVTDLHSPQRLSMSGTVQALPVCLRALNSSY